ncbi:uncharacterized protein LOC133908510 isoform X2 [Phragmites australis]|uniref:uncharacterized protein LOC133908510 isoform X2 n=1 Tax=Phragmites australis TaxID=29695 RepID=UPI002D77455C|nr:uncharacterized protein LOC133908510 isoform X2 [Phragmites australis]
MAEAHPCRRPPLGPGSAASSTAPIACEPSMATLAQQDLPPSRSATRPSPPTTVLCSTSPTAAAPPPPSSAAVSPKIPGGNRAKASDAKRFSSPIIPMVVKSPGIRLMLSPRLRSPSPMSISSSRQKASNPSHVPASTVASESAFSTGERVINDYRSRLSSDTIEALICLQDWIRENDTTSDNIAGNLMGDDDES